MRLLLVEDDPMIGSSVQSGLKQDGYSVDWVRDGIAAELAMANGVYELLLLDLGLPHKSGLDLLESLRKSGASLPVLVITARDSVADRVKGLDAGADDYLVKPFDLDELAARIRARARRGQGEASPLVDLGDVQVDRARARVFRGGDEVRLTSREWSVLDALVGARGRVVSKAGLEEALYAFDSEIEGNAVVVWSPAVLRPVAVRYAWADNPTCNLYNGAGLPAAPFQTGNERNTP